MPNPRKKSVNRKESQIVESDPGTWERFEHAVDAAVKSGPKHRVSLKPLKPIGKGKQSPNRKKAKQVFNLVLTDGAFASE